jgi:hypothetical protein
MVLLLFRIVAVAAAVFSSYLWLRCLIIMLRRSGGAARKGASVGWPNLTMSLGGCLVLIGIASEEPHSVHPIVIIGVGITVAAIGAVLRRG